jgi:hypothetical protein
MSSLPRRMQRIASRGRRAMKAAINRQFATRMGFTNPDAKDAIARARRHTYKAAPPRALRRCKPNKRWLARRGLLNPPPS